MLGLARLLLLFCLCVSYSNAADAAPKTYQLTDSQKLDEILLYTQRLEKKLAALEIAISEGVKKQEKNKLPPTEQSNKPQQQSIIQTKPAVKQQSLSGTIARSISVPLRKPTIAQKPLKPYTTTSPINQKDLEEPSEEELVYKHALSLVKMNKKNEALAQLSDFIARFPNSSVIDNAYYLLGDLYFSSKNYKLASVNFLKSYRANKKGVKTPLMMVKLVKALRLLKEYNHACAMLNRTITEFEDVLSIRVQITSEKEALAQYCDL